MILQHMQIPPSARIEVRCGEHNCPVEGDLSWRTVTGPVAGLFELYDWDMFCAGIPSPHRRLCRKHWTFTLRF